MTGFCWGLSSWRGDAHLLTVFSHGRTRDWKQSFWSPFIRTHTYPIMRTPPSWPPLNLITSPKPHLQMLSHWELGLQHRNWGKGGHNSVHSLLLPQIIQLKIEFSSSQMPVTGGATANTYYEPHVSQEGRLDCS